MLIRELETATLLKDNIFKYGPLSNLERTLKNLTISFSPLTSFNDIYENEYLVTYFANDEEDRKELIKQPHSPIQKIKEMVNEYLSALKVTCFTKSPINNLMWSHYADMHLGICYCFDFSKRHAPCTPIPVDWGEVNYSSKIPSIKVFQDQTSESMLLEIANEIVLTKSNDWSYEQEIRFFRTQDQPFISYNPNLLKAIVIGRRVSNENVDKISKMILKFNEMTNLNVKVLFAHRLAAKFDLDITSDKNQRDSFENNFRYDIPIMKDLSKVPIT